MVLAVENRVAHRAGGDQVGPRDPELLERREQVAVVRQRDLHGAIGAELRLELGLELLVIRWLDGLAWLPGKAVASPLLEDPIDLADTGVARHRSAAPTQQDDGAGQQPTKPLPHHSLPFSRAMPQIGQDPGSLLRTSGCIGQA